MLPYLLLLVVPGQIQLTNKPTLRSHKPLTPFLKECDKLGLIESGQFMDRLGQVKDFAKLKEIYESDISSASYAAAVNARELDADKVIAFCCQFELGSSNWRNAFWSLSHHRKQAVIGYIKQIAQSKDLYVRAECYLVCGIAKWDDVLEQAKEDIGCTLPLIGYGGVLPGQTVGTVAEDYIKMISKKEKERGNR